MLRHIRDAQLEGVLDKLTAFGVLGMRVFRYTRSTLTAELEEEAGGDCEGDRELRVGRQAEVCVCAAGRVSVCQRKETTGSAARASGCVASARGSAQKKKKKPKYTQTTILIPDHTKRNPPPPPTPAYPIRPALLGALR